MIRSGLLLLAPLAVFGGTAPIASAAEPARIAVTARDLPKAELRSSMQLVLHSSINGSDYLIQIFIPRRPPPPSGYPTLYALDGDALFATYAQAMGNRSGAHEIVSAVVVGISGAPGPHGADRTRDFTFSDLTPYEKSIIKDLGTDPQYGGADRFFAVMQSEIRTKVASLVHIDPSKAALLGWSLGGHYVLHTMFRHPEAFSSFIAVSPALWRSDRILFKDVPGFSQQLGQSGARPSLFLGAGGREEEAIPGLLEGEMSQPDLAAELRYGRMVGNAKDMAESLHPIFVGFGMKFEAKVFDGETHNSMPWAAVNPILDFTFPLPSK